MIKCKFPGCTFKHIYAAGVKQHARIHISDPKLRCPFVCRYCHHRLRTWGQLKTHITRHHTEDYPFTCEVTGCSYKAKFKYYLDNHKKTRHAATVSPKFPCKIEGCDFKTKRKTLLKLHITNCHSSGREKIHDCPLCAQKFFKSCQMEAHLKTHTNEKPWQCSQCSYESKSKGHLERHRETAHGDLGQPGDKRLRTCNLCDFVTRFGDTLKVHLGSHSEPVACNFPGCTFTCKWKSYLRVHEKAAPSSDRHPCPEPGCAYIGKHKTLLKDHMRTHRNKLPCIFPECDRKFNSEIAMLNHQRLHDPKRKFQCDHCRLRFGTQEWLTIHTRIIHLEGKHLKCPSCDYRANQRSGLRAHMKRMHQSQDIECNESGCNYSSCSPYDMIQHSKRHDEESSPLKCEFCSYCFTSTVGLRGHVRKKHASASQIPPKSTTSHRNSKEILQEYPCQICSVVFTDKATSRWHSVHDKIAVIVLSRIKLELE